MELLSNIYFWMWLAVVFVQTVVTFSAIGICFKPKHKMLRFCAEGAFICVLALTLTTVLVGEYPIVKTLIMIGIPIVYSVFCSEGSGVKKTIFYLICLTVDSIIEVGVNLILELSGFEMASMGEFTLQRVMLTVFSLMAMVPIKYVAARLWCRMVNKDTYGIGRFYLLFPVCQILVYYILIYENVYGELAQEFTLTLLLAVFTVLSAANVIYLHYISDIEQNNRLILQLRDMEYAHKLEAEHYTRIEEKRYELAKLRHDFRNELSAVKKLISTGSSESARELIDDLERTLDSTAEYKYCSVPVIDAVVSEKEDIISRNDIRFEHSITVAGAENVQPVHLCSIFANLMDNAIKANLEIEDGRYISLASRIRGGTITVKCENPVSGKAAVPAPSRSTGYGLKILNDIASKYDGRFSVSAENGVCTAVVTLNLMCEN